MPHVARAGRVAEWLQRFGLVGMVGVLLVLFWAVLGTFASVQHDRILDQATRDLRMVNTAVAHHAESLFRAMENDLRTVDLWLRAHPDIDPLTDPAFQALVAEMARASRGLIAVRLVDRDGQLFTVPAQPEAPSALVADRDYFRAHVDGTAAGRLVVGTPVRSRVSSEWVIPVSWRLDPAAGRFVVATCVVRMDALLAIHDRLRYRPDGTVSLVRRDGVLLSRTPVDARLLGRDVRALQHFEQDIRTGNGTFTSTGQLTDGVSRIGTYERLNDVPVTVVVSRSRADVLGSYNFRLMVVLATGATLSIVVIAFTAFLHRSQRALRRLQADLQRLATTDDLTGVANRRALTADAEREFMRARRFGRPLTVLALDIDHFKDINDRHGHAVGDRVLKACTARWARLLREQDVLGRMGGEEFCVLLTETPRHEAAVVAERLRAAVASGATEDGVRVTVSIGLATLAPADEVWGDTHDRADQALYVAKRAGRDRVAHAA